MTTHNVEVPECMVCHKTVIEIDGFGDWRCAICGRKV
jgi:ribosomal protein L37AE/L43A